MKKTIIALFTFSLLSFTTNQDKKITITFTVEELGVVYQALGELPAKQSEVIRAKIAYEFQRQTDTLKKK